MAFQLYPYQSKAVQDIRNSFIDGFNSSMLVIPTGGGKTVIFSQIAKTASEKGSTIWILVHRIELLRQTSDKLTEFGVRHGLINPKYTPNLSAPVQVASVQTVVNRLQRMPAPDLIIIDECHHTPASQYRKIIDFFSNAKKIGVTATPCRGDGTGLNHLFDFMVMGPQIGELIQLGFLVKPVVYAPEIKIDFSGVKIVRGDYDNKEVAEMMDKPTITGNAVAHYSKLCPGTPAVVFCASIDHAKHVAAEFRRSGFRAYHVDGTMDDGTRSRILEGLGNGTVDVVTSCDLISEGTDIPAVGCGILLRPTQSTGLYLQQVGRVLRKKPGKTKAIILDHVGNTLTHGMPDMDREWSLEGTKRTKKSISERSISVFQCESCYLIHEPAPECPECGFVYPPPKTAEIQEIDGDLYEVTEEQKEALKKQKVSEVRGARSIDDLLKIEKERGYKPGWAKHMHQARESKKPAVNSIWDNM